ncbi:ATP-dependent Clp protease proteolytic subunit [Thalassovita gelatinovora]|uniref:ATP-dependent Clp protease proteolytic subunit n=1 Tax=Thalassovita gelatinovora TaxID=53501 RepID=A0A0P1FFV1_THAGE|nr:head maturation protease, ClpP-related [Thalassovita gelatinovora]QIZ79784.1 hypothetical protein HFZ77_04460 [Thalassovita gelatinovora]CUH66820.1 ATP-dependent Clp protease proteolytic subunit [Thalassovita gelatinovora]SEQ43356.1 ATP-dependent protease ClpP, protease subunit [Thalassovita gelatinovora]
MKGQNLISNGEILLFGTVVQDGWIWPEDTGLFSSLMVIEALAQFQGDVTVRVNCDGGSPFEGEAIRAAFENHPGKVMVKVQGAAHSAASLMIMSADEIEMSAGSVMLIHDPSTGVWGNPAELQAATDDLTAMADTYASVYAARSGKSKEEARAIMQKGITFSATQALEEGFADRIAGDGNSGVELMPAEMQSRAYAAMMRAAGIAQAAKMKFEAAQKAASNTDGTDGAVTGDHVPQVNGEPKMSKPNATTTAPPPAGVTIPSMSNAAPDATVQNAPVASTAPATQPETTQPALAMQANGVQPQTVMQEVEADRARGRAIREMSAPFASMLAPGLVDGLIDEGKSMEEARAVVMNAVAANQPRTSRVEINRDAGQTQVEGMIGALMHQANPNMFNLEGPAEDYRGLRLKNMAMHLAGRQAGFNELDAIHRGMRSTAMTGGAHGVSDFAYITTEVMNRTLRAAYKTRPQTWRKLSRQRSASDFRALHSVSFGGDLEFKKVAETGEYESAVLNDAATSLKVQRYGRTITLTFEAVVNDDLGVFEQLPREFARKASTLESKIMWELIRSNATINGTAFFHADHGNLGGAGGITVANVGKGRKAMWEQRPFGSKDKDDFLEIEPDLLYVPPELETSALQFVAEAVPTKLDDANPFRRTLTPVTEARLGAAAGGSDTRWYLFSSDLPPMVHAYLQGYEAPTVTTKEGLNPDAVVMDARHIFGGALDEPKGAYRHGA